jgi:HEAT repeat protein
LNTEELFDDTVDDEEFTSKQDESKYSSLSKLSGLSGEDEDRFKQTWNSMTTDVKQDISTRLIDLGEDNVELDFSTIFRECLNDTDAEVRALGVNGLWEFEDRTIIRGFIHLLSSDPSSKVRSAVAQGLGRFALMAQDGKLLESESVRIKNALLLVSGSAEEDSGVRLQAMEAVSYFNTSEVIDMIRDAYRSNQLDSKKSAIVSMGQSSNPTWLPTVIAELGHSLGAIRYEAVWACGLLGEESSVIHIIPLLEDEDSEVQGAVIRAFGNIGGQIAKKALEKCLKMDDEVLVELARKVLDELAFDDDPLSMDYGV